MKILLDLDGVLVDLVKGLCDFVDKKLEKIPWPPGSYNCFKHIGIDPEEFWTKQSTPEFWANLPWMPDGKDIVNFLERKFGSKNICLLTSPGNAESVTGKIQWIEKHLPQYKRRYLIGPEKHFCSHSNSLLIDDCNENVVKFRQEGGDAILVPRLWNCNCDERHQSFEVIKKIVEAVTRYG